MTILIRCNYCGKTVPYYDNELYRIERKTGNGNTLTYDDNYRYCSKECAEKQLAKK